MAIKKSELYSSLWASCDELRGGMDASQYKDYVLVLLFVKYVSDKYAGQKGALLDVPKGGSFAAMVAAKGDKEIGDKMNKIIAKLAEANDLKGVIDVADFNNEDKLGKGSEMVDRLSNLVGIFDNPALDFRGNRAEGDDILGDAYEYLMRHFATESGKSKGQFYTPAEVSRVMAKVIGVGSAKNASQTIHDLTCGSGSLLLKAHDEAKSTAGLDLALYGQEMDNATAALARMNMILHDCATAEIWQDNVLSNPHFKECDGRLKTFDFIVANPPFSFKSWTTGFNPANDEFGRFEFGIPPTKNGDFAFLLHILTTLKSSGKAAVNMPHGVLFRGGAETDIRKNIVRRGYVKGIIGLPANLFYGTGIAACIVVLDKENAAARKGIFMIDASKGFIKDGNKNRLRAQDIHKIVDSFTRQAEIPRYSRMVPLAEISDPKNDFNLNLPRYIDSTEPEDLLDTFENARLLDPYDVYQHLMDYWAETMQDDVYMIVSDGWREAAKPRLIIEDKDKKTKEKADFTVGKMKYKADLIPTVLVIARYFAAEQATIEKLESEVAAIAQAMEEMAEEHSGEEGLLEEAKNDKDKLTKASVTERLKEIKGDADSADERKVLKEYLALIEKEAATSAKVKAAQEALLTKVATLYGKLTEDEIQSLVVDDKWLATIAAAMQGELDRVSQTLTGRIRQLAERYATPMPKLNGEVATLAARVDEHLKKMGAVC